MQNYPRYKLFKEEIEERTVGKTFYKLLLSIFIAYVVLIAIGFAFYSKYAYVSVFNVSMQNTLNPNIKDGSQTQDAVYVEFTDKINYGDIVIIKTNISPKSDTIIKRALGFGGDYISIIKINDQFKLCRKNKDSNEVEIVNEKYIKDQHEWNSLSEIVVQNVFYEAEFYEKFNSLGYISNNFEVEGVGQVKFFKVPDDEFFFLGDNRAQSTDAREIGMQKTENIEGKVVKIVHNGGKSKDNPFWWWNCIGGFIDVCWTDILRFFGGNV